MSTKYISIQEASELSKKSIQTIRRAIKSKKVIVKKKKTPQGFNYLVEFESLQRTYKLALPKETKTEVKEKVINHDNAEKSKSFEKVNVSKNDFNALVKALETMVSQHSEERQNFLRLMNTLQEKIFVLENQLNLLKEAPKKKWYSFWS